RFHGRLETTRLQAFFAGMDVMVSINKPGMLHKGNFDGFPTGGSVEASLSGVAVLASDVLEQNPGYVDGESMLICPPDAREVAKRLRKLARGPLRVGPIARAGQAASRRLFAPEVQIAPRVALIEAAAQDAGF